MKNLKKGLILVFIISLIFTITNIVNAGAKKENLDYKKMMGLKISKTKNSKLPVKDLRKLKSNGALPNIIDYSSDMPEVASQGYQGSCVGWGVGEYYKGYQEMREHNWSNTPYSAAFIYNQINGGVDNGSYIEDALLLLMDLGDCKESTMPYNQDDYLTQPNQNQLNEAANYKTEQAYYLESSVENCKLYLADEEPFIIGMLCDIDFFDIDENNQVYDVFNNNYGGHCLCVVGYDDNKQAFKVINSWGSDWGLDGYGYVSYSIWDQVVGSYNVFCMDDIIEEEPTPTEPPTPTIEPTETNTPIPTETATPTPTDPPIYKNKIIFNGAKTVDRKGPNGAGNQWKFVMKNETKTTNIKYFKANGYPIWVKKDASLISSYDGCYIKILEVDSPYSQSDYQEIKINQLAIGKNIIYLTVYEDSAHWTKWKVAVTREKVQVN